MKKNLLLAASAVVFSIAMSAQCAPVFYDGFESGSYTPTWSLGSGLTSAAVTTTNPAVGTYRIEGTGGTSTHLTGLSTTFAPATPTTMSWYIYPTGTGATNYVIAGDASVSATNCMMFAYWLGSSNVIRFVSGSTYQYSCTPGSWYFIEMRNINYTSHTFDIYINSVLMMTSFPFRSSSVNTISRVHLYNFNSGVGVWDEVRLGGLPPLSTASFTSPLCNGAASGTIDQTVTSGIAPYTYAWSTGATTEDITGITAGTYSVVVTDAIGCMDTTNIVVTEPGAVGDSTTQTNVSCFGGNNGDAGVMAFGGTGAYTYSWSPSGGTGPTESGLIAGLYTCLITDANGCTDSASVTITEPTALVTAAANNGNVCPGDTAMLIGTAMGGTMNYSYNWLPGNMSGSVASSNPASTTTYTLLVTDANGCTDSSTTTVTVHSLPVVSLGSDFASCTSAMLDAQNAGSTFLWSEGSTTQMITVNMSGPYDVVVTDGNGCTGMDTINVTINANPLVVGSAAMNFVCTGEPTVQLFESPAGGTWTGPGVFGSTFEPDTAGAGTHDLIYSYTDSLGCTGVDTVTITVDLCLGGTSASDLSIPISIYPNPTNGVFEIIFSNDAADVLIEITDVEGRVVYSSRESSVAKGALKQIDISAQADGIYLLHVRAGESNAVSRITIQH